MNDLRNKCSEESSKIEKARLQRESEVAEVKDAHQAKMDQASANLISMREAMLDKLKKEVGDFVFRRKSTPWLRFLSAMIRVR